MLGCPRWHKVFKGCPSPQSRDHKMHHDPPSHLVQQLVLSQLPTPQEGPGHGWAALNLHRLQVVQGASAQGSSGHLLTSLRQATDVGIRGESAAQTGQHEHPCHPSHSLGPEFWPENEILAQLIH